MSEERRRESRRLTHFLHSTPDAAREVNAVPWLTAMLVLLVVGAAAVALIYVFA